MLSSLKRAIKHQEEGATAVEYGIMVALIAAVIIAIVFVIGQQTCEGFDMVQDNLASNTAITTTTTTCP